MTATMTPPSPAPAPATGDGPKPVADGPACYGSHALFDQLVDCSGKASRLLLASAAAVCGGCPVANGCPDFIPFPGHRATRPEAAALEEKILTHLTANERASAAELATVTGRDITTVYRALGRLQDARKVARPDRCAYVLRTENTPKADNTTGGTETTA